jgi:rhodanese-related sulfurtransferase
MHEESSARAAQRLRELGFEAYALIGGFDAWLNAKLPTEPIFKPGETWHEEGR